MEIGHIYRNIHSPKLKGYILPGSLPFLLHLGIFQYSRDASMNTLLPLSA